jgi:hypothetical protein
VSSEHAQEVKPEAISALMVEVEAEVRSAVAQHGGMASAHEGYAVILEELDELKDEVWKNRKTRDMAAMRKEAIQVAAMGVRFVLDVCDKTAPAQPSTSIKSLGEYIQASCAVDAAASLADRRIELAVLLAAKQGKEIVTYLGEDAPSFVDGEEVSESTLLDLIDAGLKTGELVKNEVTGMAFRHMLAAPDIDLFASELIEDVHRYHPAEAQQWADAFGIPLSACINDASGE